MGALVRLDTIASYLRGLLCGLKAEQQQIDALRVRVVEYLRNGRSSGPGYRLAPYPLIWIDTDALASHVEHGTLMERMGEPTLALPFWERAYHLASKGVYLPDEPSSEWAQDMRERVEGYLHQSVHARSRLSLDEHGQAGEEEVMLLLRTYWQSHKTDEDALRPLMELLGKHERFGEAEQYYQLLLGALQEHGPERQPDQRTRDIREFLRIKHIKREHTQSLPRRSGEQERISAVHLLSEKLITVSSGVNPLIEESTPLALLKPADMSLSIPSLFQTDSDVLTRVSAELRKPSMIREGEMIYFDDQTRLYWRAREETVLPSTTLYAHVIRHIDDINLLLVCSSLPVPRSYLCEIVCRTVLLSGILLYDMGHYVKARQHYQVAFQAATEAKNPVLQAIVWGWMSFTWTYAKNYPEALRCVQRARSFAAHTTESMTQAWLGAIESEIQAHLHNRDACLQALSDMERKSGASPSQDISYLFEFHPVLLLGYKGICLQQLYQRQEPATHGLLQEAKESLEQALASEAPLKRRLYYLNDLAGVYARQGEIEAACDYVVQSIPLIMQIGSGSKTIRKHVFQVRLLLQPHEHSAAVQALDEQLVPLLSEIQTESESALA
ncbi:MAG: bacterial transcriptional activator domain-containing protein [Ktedonobacteraceae bacterium]